MESQIAARRRTTPVHAFSGVSFPRRAQANRRRRDRRVLLIAAFAGMLLDAPVGAPAGYHFPHHAMSGGMDALYEGALVEADGCVMTEGRDTVVWPPGYGFEIRDGRLVVVGGGRVVGIGEAVAIGGGLVSRDDRARSSSRLERPSCRAAIASSWRAAGPTKGALSRRRLSPPRRPRSPARPRCRHRGSRATRVSTNGAHAYRPPGVRQLRVLPRLLLRPDRPAR